MIKAIIFDLDGVIVDSVSFHFGIWKEVMGKYGVSLDENTLREINGMDTITIAEHLVEKYSLPVHPSQLVTEKKKLSRERMTNGMPFFPGVESTLTILKRLGYYLGLGTSNSRSGVELTLGTRLDGLEFDAIATDSDVERGKPSPDIFLKCAEFMKIEPTECVVVEDSISGIVAAKAGKMKAIAITTTFPEKVFRDVEVKPDIIITSISEINSELIKKLNDMD
jgi:beta-phosphoglucomutase